MTCLTTLHPKQTARNNKLLADVKRTLNARIYRHAMEEMNWAGEEACLAYLQRFFNRPVSAEFFERFCR